MLKTRVGVLRGGSHGEYEASLKTGQNVLKHLGERYHAYDIFVDKKGVWHMDGQPIDPNKAFERVDVVFNALNGFNKEIYDYLDTHGVLYTGSTTISSAVARNKVLTKQALKAHGIKTPVYKIITEEVVDPLELFRSLSMPTIAQSVSGGPTTFVQTLADLEKSLYMEGDLVFEEYIPGTVAVVGIIEGYRNEALYTLPSLEIGHMGYAIKEEVAQCAKRIFEILGLRHYSAFRFVIHPKRGIHLLGVHPSPGLTDESIFSKGLFSVGSTIPYFLDHVVELAISRK